MHYQKQATHHLHIPKDLCIDRNPASFLLYLNPLVALQCHGNPA